MRSVDALGEFAPRELLWPGRVSEDADVASFGLLLYAIPLLSISLGLTSRENDERLWLSWF